MTELRQARFLLDDPEQVGQREPAERGLVFPERFADHGRDLGAVGGAICHGTPTPGPILQRLYRPFGAARQELFALIQHRLLTTAQRLRRLVERFALVGRKIIRIRMTSRASLRPFFLACRSSCFSLPLRSIRYL